MRVRRGGGLAAVLVAAAVAGCGGDGGQVPADLVTSGSPPPTPYRGPLHVPVAEPADDEEADSEEPEAIMARAGAAGLALECDGDVYSGGGGDRWSEGDGGDTPEEGLLAWFDIEQPGLPESGYRVERREPDRVLFSLDVAGETKVAVVVAKDQPHRPGWGPDSTASCDPAELPESFTDARPDAYEIWTDRDGRRVPTTAVSSNTGPEHCEWQTAHFLGTGRGPDARLYARDPEGVLPREMLTAPFDATAALPRDAEDTGYRLRDWQLWTVPDRSAVYVRTPAGVEKWPQVRRGMGCA
ncbi:hypothetical protein GCM10027168_06770 [Streptomyces capparidis]